MFFKKISDKKYDEEMNKLLEKAKTPRDQALIGIALRVKRVSGKLYEIADPMKGYTKNNPERVYSFILKIESELDSLMNELKREDENE